MKTEEQKQFIIMQENIKALQSDVQEIKTDLKGVSQKLEQGFLDMTNKNSAEILNLAREIEKKYANKWVEKVLWGIGGIIGTGVLVAIMELIIK